MPKTLDAGTFTIGALLGRYERRRIVLPEFQRSFSWEKAQIARFWEDLIRFEKEYSLSPSTASYFLGPMVQIENEDQLLLLDGQQRLATATIALAVLRDVARGLDKRGGIKGSDLARDIQRELIEKDTDPISYALTLSELDEPYFLNAVKTDPPTVPQSKLRSHVLIQTAYAHSIGYVERLIKGRKLDDSLKIIKSIRDALTKGITLVGMIVQSESDAYTIFETLNDRGLRLSVPDLVLNLLMRRAPDGTARKLVRQHWNSTLRELGRRDVSRFLRHLWVSRYGDLKAEGLFAAIKTRLEDSKLDSVTFAEQCGDECDTYVALIDANIPLSSKESISNLQGIVRYLQIASAPPLLLAGYRSLDAGDFEKLLIAIITTYIRYVIVTNQNPLDLETRFFEAARLIRQNAEACEPSWKQLKVAKEKLAELNVADNAILQGAKDLVLERSDAVWLMTKLANSKQSVTGEIGMDKANLEHIFPQNPTLAAWPNSAALETLTWHIGNLTILGEKLNRKAQNKSFTDKKTLYFAKSEIEMTKQILGYTQWDENSILQRGADLTKAIAELWPPL